MSENPEIQDYSCRILKCNRNKIRLILEEYFRAKRNKDTFLAIEIACYTDTTQETINRFLTSCKKEK